MSLIKKLISIFKKPTKKQSEDHNLKSKSPIGQSSDRNQFKSKHQKEHQNQQRHKNLKKNNRNQKDNYRQQKPKKSPAPKKYQGKEFKDLGLHPDLVELLKKSNFTHATEVQEKSMASNIAGKNIFCSSETGSGKTLSFLVPMLHKFYNKEISQALIICPTREIAIQIQKTLNGFKDESLTSALVIGGTNIKQQKKDLQEYPKILVATPGRLLDMMNTGLIWLQYTGYVVLDEADRMLDMGFEDELNKICAELTGKHQMILFSATLFPEVKKMAKRLADDFEEIVIGDPTSVAVTIDHVLVEIESHKKQAALKYLMRKNPGKMMVFFNTIRDTSNITRQLMRQRIMDIDCIHSKVVQSAREKIITEFREGEISALLASDVAARGIDIPNVELVVNYDVPNNSEEYIHRVGRTGRAGQTGVAITFYSPKDKKKLLAIEKLIGSKIKRVRDYRDIL